MGAKAPPNAAPSAYETEMPENHTVLERVRQPELETVRGARPVALPADTVEAARQYRRYNNEPNPGKKNPRAGGYCAAR